MRDPRRRERALAGLRDRRSSRGRDPAGLDFAFPFEGGAAVVCEGCTFRPVVPVVHSREALRAIHPW